VRYCLTNISSTYLPLTAICTETLEYKNFSDKWIFPFGERDRRKNYLPNMAIARTMWLDAISVSLIDSRNRTRGRVHLFNWCTISGYPYLSINLCGSRLPSAYSISSGLGWLSYPEFLGTIDLISPKQGCIASVEDCLISFTTTWLSLRHYQKKLGI
jgi:hypothetical protein